MAEGFSTKKKTKKEVNVEDQAKFDEEMEKESKEFFADPGAKITKKEGVEVVETNAVEIEKWLDVDDTAKARTRVVIRGSSVKEVIKVLNDAIEGLGAVVATPVEQEPVEDEEPTPPPPPAKKAWSGAKKSAGGASKYKKGRTLNKELGDEEPTVCPDCGSKMFAKEVSNGTKRVVTCPKDGNNWWDNSFEG